EPRRCRTRGGGAQGARGAASSAGRGARTGAPRRRLGEPDLAGRAREGISVGRNSVRDRQRAGPLARRATAWVIGTAPAPAITRRRRRPPTGAAGGYRAHRRTADPLVRSGRAPRRWQDDPARFGRRMGTAHSA